MTPPGSEPDPETETGSNREASQERRDAGPPLYYTLFECQECSALALGVHDGSAELSCHGQPMETVEEEGVKHEEPDLEQIFTEVYDVPRTIIDICHFVFEEGTTTVEETAERFGYERNSVAEYLHNLAEKDLLERRSKQVGDGGEVHVYEARDMEEASRDEMVGFLRWAGRGAEVLNEANEVKDWCLRHDDKSLERSFWEVYEERSTL